MICVHGTTRLTPPSTKSIASEEIARQQQTQDRSRQTPEQHDERRLDQERQRHCPALEADRAQHADLLSALDHRPERDHADGRQSDDQPEPHEALEDVQEAARLRLEVLQLILDGNRPARR